MSEKQDKLKRALGVEGGEDRGSNITNLGSGKTDYRYLFSILEALPLEKMNLLDICKAVYESFISP